MKKVLLWITTIFLLILSLASLPSITSIFLMLVVAILIPVDKWQSLINKYLKGKIKVIVSVTLIIVALITIPQNSSRNTNNDKSKKTDSTSHVTQSDEPKHIHDFIPATCQTPKTCKECNKTEGKPIEHKWVQANCLKPKTCTNCGLTEGDTLDHNWVEANCTTPKKCSTCDTTDGNALGHDWKNATCTSPKTCANCNKTEGDVLGHSYSSGYCTICSSKDPNYVSETMVWIPTNGGGKYHSNSTCSNMIDPIQTTKTKAINQGLSACKKCYG